MCYESADTQYNRTEQKSYRGNVIKNILYELFKKIQEDDATNSKIVFKDTGCFVRPNEANVFVNRWLSILF